MRAMTFLSLLAVLVVFCCGGAFAQPMLVPAGDSPEPLGLEYYRVDATAVEGALKADVELGFRNDGTSRLEAVFVFPLPPSATVSAFSMEMNGKWVQGKVMEKGEAAKTYREIVLRLKDPGLIELLSSGKFQARVFPVMPGAVQRLKLEVTAELQAEGGFFRVLWPLKAAERFRKTCKDFTFTLRLKTSAPLKAVYSPSHELAVSRKGGNEAVASLEKLQAAFDADLSVFFSGDEREFGLSSLAWRPKGEPGYFMLVASPGGQKRAAETAGKNLLLVVDTSGSMEGEKLRHTKQALAYILQNLKSEDGFNLIRFSSDVELMFPAFRPLDRAGRQKALDFVSGLTAEGGTALYAALLEAARNDPGENGLIVLLTDGEPTVGETGPSKIVADFAAANRPRTRLFPFGVGTDVNAILLDRLAADSRGRPTYVGAGEDINRTLSAFYDRLSHPVLEALSIEVRGSKTFSLLPDPLPDLFKGDQLVLLGRYRDAGDVQVLLRGRIGDEKKVFEWHGTFPEESSEHGFVATLWARRQVGVLLEKIRLEGETKALVDELVRLATRFGIVTPYTSYLVTEPEGSVPPPRPLPPSPFPGPIPVQRDSFGGGVGARAAAPQAVISGMSGMNLLQSTGAEAVQTSVSIQKMKDEDRVSGAAAVTTVDGREFRLDNGAWEERTAEAGGRERLQIRTFGEAWLRLAGKSASLARILALGERVSFLFGPYLLDVSPDALEPTPDLLWKKLELD